MGVRPVCLVRMLKNNDMSDFKVYFEIYGKKLMKRISADSEYQAREKIKNDIVFHKIVIGDLNDAVNELRDIFGELFNF